jgi:hypothetical protein
MAAPHVDGDCVPLSRTSVEGMRRARTVTFPFRDNYKLRVRVVF